MAQFTWTPNHTKLRDILAGLYPDRASAVTIIQPLGANPAFMPFNDLSVSNWHTIINKAANERWLVQLVEATIVQNPMNGTLKELLELFKKGEEGEEAGRGSRIESLPPLSDLQLRDFINQYFEKNDIANVLGDLTDKLQQDGKIESSTTIDIGAFSDQSNPKSAIAREMVGFFRRRGWTPYLIAALKDARPDPFREKFGD